jgi:hypothetical protein
MVQRQFQRFVDYWRSVLDPLVITSVNDLQTASLQNRNRCDVKLRGYKAQTWAVITLGVQNKCSVNSFHTFVVCGEMNYLKKPKQDAYYNLKKNIDK